MTSDQVTQTGPIQRNKGGGLRPRAKRWLPVAALTLAVSAAALAPAGPSTAASLVLQNGEVVEGEVIAATRSTLMVRKDRGGVRQLIRSSVETVGVTTSKGRKVIGRFLGWSKGIYEIETEEAILLVSRAKVVESRPRAEPQSDTAEKEAEKKEDVVLTAPPPPEPVETEPVQKAAPVTPVAEEEAPAKTAQQVVILEVPAAAEETQAKLPGPKVSTAKTEEDPADASALILDAPADLEPLEAPAKTAQLESDLPVPLEDSVAKVPPPQIEGWVSQLDSARRELLRLRRANTEMQTQLDARSREVTASEERSRQLQARMERLEEKLAAQDTESAAITAQWGAEKESLAAARRKVEAELSAAVAERASLDKELAARAEALSRAELLLEEAQAVNKALYEQIAEQLEESEAESQKGAQLQQRLAQLEEQAETAEDGRSRAERAQWAAEKLLSEERTRNETEKVELKGALDAARSETAALGKDLQTALERLKDVETAKAELERERLSGSGKLSELEAERDSLQNLVAAARREADRVAVDLKDSERDRAVGEQVLADERKRTLSWLTLAAEAGFPAAQTSLGYRFRHGRGVEQDDAQAVEWYRKAASQGYPQGQNNLGYMYANGLGVEKDEPEAVHWYRLAADQGYARAQSNLGYMLAKGIGVKQNFKEALHWFDAAAKQGHAVAMKSMGVMYEFGYGVDKDMSRAKELYEAASAREAETAQGSLFDAKDAVAERNAN